MTITVKDGKAKLTLSAYDKATCKRFADLLANLQHPACPISEEAQQAAQSLTLLVEAITEETGAGDGK